MNGPMRLALLLALPLAACDQELLCPSGEVDCGGTCVSLLSDAEHCGACGSACSALEVCSAGACACAPGVSRCGDTCTDLARDPDHCLACETACGDAQPICDGRTGCVTVETCLADRTACDGACVDLASDAYHCGTCGNSCAAGQQCRAGECRADIYVACMASQEVMPVTAELALAGDALSVPGSPFDVALLGPAVFVANAPWGANANVKIFPLDPTRAPRIVPLESDDLQRLEVHDNMMLLTNAGAGTLLVLDSEGNVVSEIALPDQQLGPNPHGVAVQGTTAWVALYGHGPSSGQKIAKIDLASGQLVGVIDLLGIPGTHDAPGLPLPDAVVADDTRVYVTLKNLADDPNDTYGVMYAIPAGSGRVAMITPAADDDVTILDLGASCGSPGDLVLRGSTLWVACGAYDYPELAPRRLLPIDVSTGVPVPGAAIELGDVVPAKMAFCGGMGYVGDMKTGAVVRFDPVAGTAETPVHVCPFVGWASVTDVACAD